MGDDKGPLESATKRPLSFAKTIKAVFWSFFGVRNNQQHQQDMTNLNPVYVVLAGVLVGVMLIIGLLAIVRSVIN